MALWIGDDHVEFRGAEAGLCNSKMGAQISRLAKEPATPTSEREPVPNDTSFSSPGGVEQGASSTGSTLRPKPHPDFFGSKELATASRCRRPHPKQVGRTDRLERDALPASTTPLRRRGPTSPGTGPYRRMCAPVGAAGAAGVPWSRVSHRR